VTSNQRRLSIGFVTTRLTTPTAAAAAGAAAIHFSSGRAA